MKVRATVSFSGSRISMYEGEEREIVSGDILADLFNAGYIEKVTEEIPSPAEEKKPKRKTTVKGKKK